MKREFKICFCRNYFVSTSILFILLCLYYFVYIISLNSVIRVIQVITDIPVWIRTIVLRFHIRKCFNEYLVQSYIKLPEIFTYGYTMNRCGNIKKSLFYIQLINVGIQDDE